MEVIPAQPAQETPTDTVDGAALDAKDKIIAAQSKALAAQAETIRQLQLSLERIQAQLAVHLRARFGQRSEVVDPATLLPFAQDALQSMLTAGEAVSEQVKAEAAGASEEPSSAKDKPKRKPLPAHLERVRIVHALPEAQRKCPCCGEVACKSGEATSERLQYVPARVFVEQHVEEKYACPTCRNNGCGRPGCEGQILQAKKPPQAIEKSMVGAGLLAQIAVGKYGDHLPLHRMEDILPRHGIELTRSTLCDWMMEAAELLVPLVALAKQVILQGKGVQLDDTTVQMQEPGKGRTTTARCWVYQGDELHRLTVFDFQPNRDAEHPENWFEGIAFPGHGQGDAYLGYNPLFAKDRPEGPLVPVGCWAHVRRKFFDAKKADPRANEILFLIQKLYAVEKRAKAKAGLHEDGPTHAGGKDPKGKMVTGAQVEKLWEARKTLREESLQIIEGQIKPWLDGMQAQALPRSPMGEAVGYALNQWPRLTEYARHGHVEIDNNAAERSLRCVAVGRKNWMFVGSPRGGRTLATMMSVIASAKHHGHEPYAYLRDLFEKLPALRERGWPEVELRKVLPDQWRVPAA